MAQRRVRGGMTARGWQFRVLAAALTFTAGALAQSPPDAVDAGWQSYRAHVAAAQAWLELNEPGRAREWIEAAPAEHRGWEWHYLAGQLDRSLSVLHTDEDGFMSVAVCRDGKLAACLTGRGKLSIVALPAGTLLRSWDAHVEGGGFTVRFSPDGAHLATSGADRLVKVWDTATGDLKLTFAAHKFPVGGLAWSPDAARIASSAYYMDDATPIEGRIHVWNTADGAIVHTLTSGRKPIVCLDWSRNGRYLAAGTWDSEVAVWGAGDGALVRVINEKPSENSSSHVDAVALSPDAELVAYGSDRKWVRVHRIDTGALAAELTSHGQPISALAFSPDGSRLATGGGDDTIRIWERATWKESAILRGHRGRVRGLAFSPDGSRLYSASLDGTVRSWDPADRAGGGLRFAHGCGNYSVSFSPDGTRIAGAGYDGVLPIWDARRGTLSAHWSAHEPRPVCMSDWSPDGRRIVTCSWDQTARVFDVNGRTELLKLDHEAGVGYVAWSPDGKLIATACNDKQAHLWDAQTGERLRSLAGHEAQVNEVRFSADGSRAVTASSDQTARVWDVAGGACTSVLRGHDGGVLSACFSPDGSRIATGAQDGAVRLWNAASGELVSVALEEDEAIHRVAFSPDGSRLASGGRELVLLDPRRPGAAARLRVHADAVWNIDWSPDGSRLATGSWDGSVVILDARAGKVAETQASR